MYELLGLSLVLATLLTINAAASMTAAVCWRLLQRPARHWSSRSRAEILFAMRVSPPALALICVGLFLLPSYLGYEPYSTSEVVSKKLATLAVISVSSLSFALWRAFRSFLATRALRREWLASAHPITLPGISIPTFRIRHSFPVIAVVGTFKPRLFIAEHVLKSLNKEELIAAIAHECGHLAAHDNFKRALLRGCRDALMIVPSGRALDRAWAETAECAADEQAAQQSTATALNLASALVRIAKMVPVGVSPEMPLATFLVGVQESTGVKARVRRLLEIASPDYQALSPAPSMARPMLWISFVMLVLLGTSLGSTPRILATVHLLIERIVFLLS